MSERKVVTYVEIDIDYCSLTYGTAPCTASIPGTGAAKCFNTQKTCQDIANFANSPLTIRFAIDTGYLPDNIDCIPNLVSVSYTPIIVSLGEDLGVRANISCTFKDHRHSDAGLDKYLADRSYNPFAQGSFWGKFRARVPYLRGRPFRLIRGEVGQALAAMDTRHFVIESFSGPNTNGEFTLTAKDVLKFADNDRAVAPTPGIGSLISAITETSNQVSLTPSGVGDLEYGQTGFVAIGGKEICEYTRDAGIDANTLLLLHFGGADASTTFTDSSPSARTATVNANAQIDTAQSKFGGSSGLFDGTDDYINYNGSSDFAFGTADFTIDMWVRRVGAGISQGLYGGSPASTTGVYVELGINSSNVLVLIVNGVTRITGSTVVATGAFQHVALVRHNGVSKLYLNGAQEGSSYTDTNSYLNGANRPTIGANGPNPTLNEFNGWLDEVRVSSVARWFGPFTVPTAAYAADGTDLLDIYRAKKETTAVSHNAGSRAQEVLVYTAADPADIIYDLLVNYAGVDPDVIPLSSWQAETGAYLQRLYNAYIPDPIGISKLISELINQAALSIWWDEVSQVLNLQVLRDLSGGATAISEELYLNRSLQVVEQPEKRISQVWTYYAQRNPLKQLDETENYESILVTVDLESEGLYGSAAIRRIFSRWISTGGQTTAERVNDILIARYKNPPRKFSLGVLRGTADDLSIGQGYSLSNWALQEADGSAESVPVQLTSIVPDAAMTTAIAEEIQFAGVELDDPNTHEIVITSNINNVNLRTLHDSLFAAISGAGITVRCTIGEGAVVWSSSTGSVAFDVGTWSHSPTIEIIVLGRIQGKGGAGASVYLGEYNGHNGGTALYTRQAISLTVEDGEIFGGGGGGSANPSAFNTAGGGGAGTQPGAGGQANPSYPAFNGYDGTADAGGIGGPSVGGSYVGGAGGGPGLNGSVGTAPGAGTGGTKGYAIDGISYVTVVGGAGDRRGTEGN